MERRGGFSPGRKAAKFRCPFLQDCPPSPSRVLWGRTMLSYGTLLSVERNNRSIWWTFLLPVSLELFTRILLFSLLLKSIALKKRGKQKHIQLQGNVIPFFPSTTTWDLFYEPHQTQEPLPFTLVQMFLLVCLLLGLTVLTAPAQKRTLQFKINNLLEDKLRLLDLPRLELLAPAMTCAQQPMTQQTLTSGAGDSSPPTALSVIGINKASRETQTYLHLGI